MVEYNRPCTYVQVDALTDDQPEAVRAKLLPALIKGVASHHAGHLPGWKSLVERLFQKYVFLFTPNHPQH